KLRKYVRRLLFPYSKLPPLPAPPTDHLQVREMAKAEAAALCARFILEGGQTTGAEPLVRQAREGAPELAATHEAAGLLHVLEKEYPEAARAFERAQALDAAGPLASYGLAVLGFYEDRGRESLAIVESRLQQILRLDPEFAPARARLAEVYRRTDATPERALASIREARRLRPDDLRDRLKEAQILLNGGER
ncbi:MAG: hypothetical protein KDD47_24010, partial [Acidobacteria bacterium]|nr:hypothetical protein [Acidobacteriota bacterium]